MLKLSPIKEVNRAKPTREKKEKKEANPGLNLNSFFSRKV